MAITVVRLDPAGWTQLRNALNSNQLNPHLTQKIVEHLQALGAQTFLMEDDYIDRDFTDAFAAYYSRLFKRHSKICTRVHFFSRDLEGPINSPTDREMAEALQNCEDDYLGFVVLRPVHQAPIAAVVLRTPTAPAGHESHPLVKAKYSTHVLGAQFHVDALPMTQQDQRIGACAQAAIWSAARHFHARHSGPWVSMVGITESAMVQEGFTVSSTLPNGSEFLSMSGIVSALRGSGRKPLFYMADNPAQMLWQGVRPADVINRYVDSGIPVIVGLGTPGENIGHAVIASGQVFSHIPPAPQNLPPRPTRAAFCSAFYVNDDQRGPNLRMPRMIGDAIGETEYSVEGNVQFLIIPLPDKVFLPAEKAELLAWDLLEKYARSWPALRAQVPLGVSEALGDDFTACVENNTAVARTYLTYGWKYKHRMLRNGLADATKGLLNSTELPRYVWVTEFGTLNSFSPVNRFERRIFAHCVVDATAKNMGEDSCLFFHAPGAVVRRAHDVAEPYGPYDLSTHAIIDDQAYYPKLRGKWDFVGY
ncbi:hypothetical protein OCK02_02050 [Rhizobium sp. TRM96647]|uniref:hypothetical protein n=1 Tax=unclassified Rhizobium TaxID=2613769 RepID=UPI0021E835D6|nr:MULTISPECIES: hypothetical protein [unclassified Rhizobium]MCV3734971.1 hypothetical protein [Rhizobium sp. TRM96647]MCV3757341.1 hypothetical protein [Rhizobium sp. TRM96650]